MAFYLTIAIIFFTAWMVEAMEDGPWQYFPQINLAAATNLESCLDGDVSLLGIVALTVLAREPRIFGKFININNEVENYNLLLRDFQRSKMIIISHQYCTGKKFPLFIDGGGFVNAVILMSNNKCDIIRFHGIKNIVKISVHLNRLVTLDHQGRLWVSDDDLMQKLSNRKEPSMERVLLARAKDFWFKSMALVYLTDDDCIFVYSLSKDQRLYCVSRSEGIQCMDIAQIKEEKYIRLIQ